MKFVIFVLLLLVLHIFQVFSDDTTNANLLTKCPMPDDINTSKQSRLRHSCESNQIPQFAIETRDEFYCIFYSVSSILLFGAETTIQIKFDGDFIHEFSGVENFEFFNKTIKFIASMEDVIILISRQNDDDEMPQIRSVIIEDGILPDNERMPTELCINENCGLANEAVGVIIGGMESREGYWPWNVAIYHRPNSTTTNFRCAATIVNKRTLITTATCLTSTNKPIPPERLIVAVRETTLFSLYGKKLAISDIKLHENFTNDEVSKLKFDFNVALVIMMKDIEFSPKVNAICLPNSNRYDFKGKRGVVVGWGLSEAAEMTQRLRQIEVPTFPYLECFYRNREYFSGFSSKRHFCAGARNGRGLCVGDSGGGLYIKNDKKFSLYGISAASNCICNMTIKRCETFDEGIFVNIVTFIQWIHNNMY